MVQRSSYKEKSQVKIKERLCFTITHIYKFVRCLTKLFYPSPCQESSVQVIIMQNCINMVTCFMIIPIISPVVSITSSTWHWKKIKKQLSPIVSEGTISGGHLHSNKHSAVAGKHKDVSYKACQFRLFNKNFK